jgi:hypothetical protein
MKRKLLLLVLLLGCVAAADRSCEQTYYMNDRAKVERVLPNAVEIQAIPNCQPYHWLARMQDGSIYYVYTSANPVQTNLMFHGER